MEDEGCEGKRARVQGQNKIHSNINAEDVRQRFESVTLEAFEDLLVTEVFKDRDCNERTQGRFPQIPVSQ